jgi:hypothetical protein
MPTYLEREREVIARRRQQKNQQNLEGLVRLVRDEFKSYSEHKVIAGFDEKKLSTQSHTFLITLFTGQQYKFYISLNRTKENELLHLSSKLDSVIIGSFYHLNDRQVVDFVYRWLIVRKAGYDLEAKVFKTLEAFIRSPKNIFFKKVRKGDIRDELLNRDFILECRIGGYSFEVSFDIKKNPADVIKNRERKHAWPHPSICTNLQELRDCPEKFIEKIHYLTSLVFKKRWLDPTVKNEKFHIL